MLESTIAEKRAFYISLLQALIEKVPSASIQEADYVIKEETKRLEIIGSLELAITDNIGVTWSLAFGFEYEGDEPCVLPKWSKV